MNLGIIVGRKPDIGTANGDSHEAMVRGVSGAWGAYAWLALADLYSNLVIFFGIPIALRAGVAYW